MMSADSKAGEVLLERPPSENGSGVDLVSRAQAGDRRAFEALYRLHVGRVYAICRRISGDSTRAEELTQDVFVQTWKVLGSYRGDSLFSSWLHRIAVNTVLLDLRTVKRRAARILVTGNLLVHDRPSETGSLETSLDLEKAIAALPPQARAVFVLHDVEGYRHDEVAGLMKLAVGTTKAQLHRARRLLREAIER